VAGKNAGKESDYVDFFYDKYQGRVSVGVGYNQNLSEVFPLVFQNPAGESIGIVALGVVSNGKTLVYIYHLGAFQSKRGDGSEILKELCDQADKFNICLGVGAVFMPNGKDTKMEPGRLVKWYESYGFEDDSGLLREPVN